MIARVQSFILSGIDPVPCEVEADLSPAGLPSVSVVGLPGAAVRESGKRVRTAVLNSGFRFPNKRLTINLAPAHVRKEGPVYDLPIALALLMASGTIARRQPLDDLLAAGELALDGRVRPIRGAISLAMLAQRLGRRGVILPSANAREAAVVEHIEVYGIDTLSQAVELLNGTGTFAPEATVDVDALLEHATAPVDFAAVRGQETAKRAIAIAAAGAHNVLLVGPAGSGKTMMARALPGILPPLTRAEALEVTRLYSCAGLLAAGRPLVLSRPVRAPHHTASSAAIVGGGTIPRPGDVSLAHRGVLFLDEMPEFSRAVLETLRQPLEDGVVTIARVHGTVSFPARFMLVGALNPTQDGDAGMDDRARDRYLARLSGPLVDRIDLHVEVGGVPIARLRTSAGGRDTATMRHQVLSARRRQDERQGPETNSVLSGDRLDRHCRLDAAAGRLLEEVMTELGLSARSYDKLRRVARSIADLDGLVDVASEHVAEAAQFRQFDRWRAGR